MKFSFLPAFFIALGVVFAAAVTYKVHSYTTSEMQAETPTAPPSDVQMASSSRPAAGQAAPLSGQITLARSSADAPLMNARERRYNELLHGEMPMATPNAAGPVASPSAPPPRQLPAAAPPPPAPKQSLISRIVSPIANAFNGRSGDSSASSSRQPQQPKHDQPKEQDPQPKDPNSDSTPPQLISIEFQPPQVQDGGETTLIIFATDDLSGVRNISGSIGSPSGKALQGFAMQREGPDSNRYLTRIAIPKDAEEGLWKINFLSMSDMASNTVNLNAGQGTMPASAVLRVISNRPDSQPPTLKNVWLEKRAMKAGEKNVIHIQVDDDKSGVQLVSGVFQSPSKFARIGFGCHATDAETWDCEMQVPQCLDCGEWQLEQIQMQDKANNMGAVRGDNPLVSAIRLQISGDQCDSAPPVLSGVALDNTSMSNAQENTVTITTSVSDDMCGVSSVSGQVIGPASGNSQRPLYFTCAPTGDPNVWVGRLAVPIHAAIGTWSVVWINVLDKGNNLKTYSKSDPPLANASFVVH